MKRHRGRGKESGSELEQVSELPDAKGAWGPEAPHSPRAVGTPASRGNEQPLVAGSVPDGSGTASTRVEKPSMGCLCSEDFHARLPVKGEQGNFRGCGRTVGTQTRGIQIGVQPGGPSRRCRRRSGTVRVPVWSCLLGQERGWVEGRAAPKGWLHRWAVTCPPAFTDIPVCTTGTTPCVLRARKVSCMDIP